VQDDRDLHAYERSSEHYSLTSSVQGTIASSQPDDVMKCSRDDPDASVTQSLQSSQVGYWFWIPRLTKATGGLSVWLESDKDVLLSMQSDLWVYYSGCKA